MELQAITGKLYVVNGVQQETAYVPGLLAQSAPANSARGRDKDFLFVHLSLSGQPDKTAPLAQDLIDSLSLQFYQTPGSVTASLRKAIIETNKLLLGLNLSGATKSREGAIICSVLRGQELFMAQTGEAFAMLGHNFGIERLPADPPSKITPLGRTAGLDIRLYHYWLESGDILLLSDPRLAHIPPAALEPVLIDTEIEDGLQNLAQLVGPDSARAILVEFTDEAPGYVPDADHHPSESAIGRDLTPPIGPPVREAASQETYRQGPDPTPINKPAVDLDSVETSARKVSYKAARGTAVFTGWLADFLSKLQPSESQSGERNGWAIPVALAVLIPILVAVIVAGVYVQRGRVARVSDIKQEMRENYNLALQADSEEEVIAYLNEVLRLAEEGQELRPDDGDIAELKIEALEEIDNLSGVARLRGRSIQQFGEDTFLSSLVLGDELNGDIYLLDMINNVVYRLQTDENYQIPEGTEPQSILLADDIVGSHVVTRIMDMMWRPRGNSVTRDGLAMLDASGALVSFYPNFSDSRATPLGLASDWVLPKSITSFDERLYILDVGAAEIWRYFPDGDGFTTNEQRTIAFSEDVDLKNVNDLAIYSEDGSVILIYNDGRIRRYAQGRVLWSETELATNGLDIPLVNPVAIKIIGRGLNSSIFILDPGSGRIVQLSLGGTFLAQYKAVDSENRELFAEATDFFVVDNPLRIFVAVGNELFLATQN